jgi:hypothetical protein
MRMGTGLLLVNRLLSLLGLGLGLLGLEPKYFERQSYTVYFICSFKTAWTKSIRLPPLRLVTNGLFLLEDIVQGNIVRKHSREWLDFFNEYQP